MEAVIEWYVGRHGQTTDNKDKIWTGQLPGKLNEEGRLFAQQDLGQLIRLIQPDLVCSSNLKRAVDTKDIAIGCSGYQGQHYEDGRLREVCFTDFHGLTMDQINELIALKNLEQFADLGYDDLRYMFAELRGPLEQHFGAESIPDIKERVSSFSNEVRSLPIEGGRRVISVGHGIINAYIVENEIYRTCGERFDKDGNVFYPQSNDEITIFRYDRDGRLFHAEINIPIKNVVS